MDLVLLRLSALGDILRVLPAWANLRAAFPGSRFRAVVEDRHAFLLEPLPWLQPVLVRRKRLSNPLTALLKDRCELRWSLGPEEEDLRAWLPEASGVEALPRLGFWQLAAALRQAHAVVAPDTGLLHLAVVLGVPALGLYGSSDPVVAGLPEGAGRVLRTGIACSPCRERACQRRQCLEELSPGAVAEALMGLLAAR